MTSLANFNVGQEIISQDLNKIAPRIEQFLFDKVLFELMGRKTDAFYQDGLKVSRVSATQLSVKAGLGFHTEIINAYDPNLKPLFLGANSTQNLSTPDNTNDRIDIISVKAIQIDSETESRKFKDEFTQAISLQNLVVSKDWSIQITVTEGTPSGSPAVPATPAGEIKLCDVLVEAINGVTVESNITDKRLNLPVAAAGNATGFVGYDAVVGDLSIIGVTHSTLKAAIDDAAILAGAKILVIGSETINITPDVNKDDLTIEFKGSATLTKGTANTGLLISSDGVKVLNGRFASFSVGGDKAISIAATFQYCMIRNIRFLNCDTEIEDLGTKNDFSGLITE